MGRCIPSSSSQLQVLNRTGQASAAKACPRLEQGSLSLVAAVAFSSSSSTTSWLQ